jgi:S-adenosylmethionine-dependent methyltransferase
MSQEQEGKSTAERFAQYQESTASYLRYQQAQSNLVQLHDLDRPRRVLDAGGGNGINSEHLLRLGHEVTLLDSDPEMLRDAGQRLEKAGLLERCQLVEGSLEEMAELLPVEHFELVLCHHVIEYLDDVPTILSAMQQLTVGGGELSLITLNPVSEVIRAAVFRHDPALAASRLTSLSYDARWFGNATLYPEEQITAWAEQAGWLPVETRGIRVLADYIPESELTEEKKADLLQLEKELAGMEPYRRFGRYIQHAFRKEVR